MSQPTTSTSDAWSAAIWLSSSASKRAAASERNATPKKPQPALLRQMIDWCRRWPAMLWNSSAWRLGAQSLTCDLVTTSRFVFLNDVAFGQVDDAARGGKRGHRRGERGQIVGDAVADGAVVLRVDDRHHRQRRPGSAGSVPRRPVPAPPPVPDPPPVPRCSASSGGTTLPPPPPPVPALAAPRHRRCFPQPRPFPRSAARSRAAAARSRAATHPGGEPARPAPRATAGSVRCSRAARSGRESDERKQRHRRDVLAVHLRENHRPPRNGRYRTRLAPRYRSGGVRSPRTSPIAVKTVHTLTPLPNERD